MLYIAILIWDIIKSNLEVLKLVLGPMNHLQPGMIAVPLDISEPLPITMLANTITLTPGTVSAEVSADMKYLYVHCLHLEDEAARIAEIKERYEAPLKRIFKC
jgi:multicomponent K+:H+ antiporter subunit E